MSTTQTLPAPPSDAETLIGRALTDYVITSGRAAAPANDAPRHVADYLARHGYTITRKQV